MSQEEMSTCMLRDGVVSVAPRRGEGEWEQAAGRRKKEGGGQAEGGASQHPGRLSWDAMPAPSTAR
jgi:hypothetical protein